MKRPLRGLGIVAALVTGLALGCPEEEEPGVQCEEIGCDGGFDLWLTSTNVSDVFDEGRYDVMIEFGQDGDGGEVEIECEIDGAGNGSCEAADWKEPSTEDITVTAQYGDPAAQQAISTPAIQVHFEGRSDAPAGDNVFGPAVINVEIDRDTRKVGEQVYTPEYERDDEFQGHVDCGYCDSLEREILRLDP